MWFGAQGGRKDATMGGNAGAAAGGARLATVICRVKEQTPGGVFMRYGKRIGTGIPQHAAAGILATLFTKCTN